jgi:hypothetical protein
MDQTILEDGYGLRHTYAGVLQLLILLDYADTAINKTIQA